MRGSILDTNARARINIWIYIKSGKYCIYNTTKYTCTCYFKNHSILLITLHNSGNVIRYSLANYGYYMVGQLLFTINSC